MTTQTSKKQEEDSLTIAQRAGYARRKLKNRGIEILEDYSGKSVPIGYVPDIDIIKHWECHKIMQRARDLKQHIAEFKWRCQQVGDNMYAQLMHEDEIKNSSKGGFTMGKFDKSESVIYKMDTVQVKIPEELTKADTYWERFLGDYVSSEDDKIEMLKAIVDDVIHNSKDQIDTRQIGRLNRYGAKLDDKNYHKFLEHLNKAYDVRHTKRYEQFRYRDEQNSDQSIVLTYTRIKPQRPDHE